MFALPLLFVVASLAQAPSPLSQQVVVRHVTLNGVTQLTAAEQEEIARSLEKSYGIISFGHIDENLRDALQEHGFYKAAVEEPKVTVVSGTELNGTVDVSFHVDEGQRYHLKSVSFTNNHAFSPQELRDTIPMSNGDVFSTAEARQGFEELRKLYVSRGYIDFVPYPELIVDEPAATVTLKVDLSEGVPFRVGVLAFDGGPPATDVTQKLQTAWKKYEGRTYSGDLLSKFVRENAGSLPPNKNARQIFHVVVDEDEHVLHFRLDVGAATPARPEP